MMKDTIIAWLLVLLIVGLSIFVGFIGNYIIKLIYEFIFGSNLVLVIGV